LLSLYIVLFFGIDNAFALQHQSNNQTQFLSSIKIAKDGSHGADLFVDPKTNEIYIAYIQTHNNSNNLFYTKSINDNQNFTKPVKINDKVGDVM
jgi:uncharacterized protein (UPF0333 family)